MRRTAEEAVQLSRARQKLRVVLAGQGYLIVPYKPAAAYNDGHWVPPPLKRWVECPGASECTYHHLPVIVKCHVPALVSAKCYRADDAARAQFDREILFRGESWVQRIVEITAGCIPVFVTPTEPDQLAVIYRKGPARNGPLSLEWRNTRVKGVPADLAHMDLDTMLPAIIHGRLRTHIDKTALDNSDGSPIKHKINYPTESSESA